MTLSYILVSGLTTLVCALLFGLVVSYAILKVQRRPWPFSWRRARSRSQGFLSAQTENAPPANPISTLYRDQGLGSSGLNDSGPVVEPPAPSLAQLLASLPRTEFVLEIESNLSTACTPQKNTLVPFRIRVLEAENGRADSLRPEVREAIKAAYTDIRLANTLVNLSSATGYRRPEIYNSYIGLCNCIADRLEKLTVSLVSSGGNATSS